MARLRRFADLVVARAEVGARAVESRWMVECLQAIVGDVVPKERRETFLDRGPEVIDFLLEKKLGNSGVVSIESQFAVYEVAFSSESPTQAAEITNELVTLILQENVSLRTGRAGSSWWRASPARSGQPMDAGWVTRSTLHPEFDARDSSRVSKPMRS